MSMVLFLIPYLLFPLSIRAGPLSTASLSPSLTGIIPECAQSCLKSSVTQNFPACQHQQDLSCLCTNDTVSGLTLGEQALACLASACPFDVFNIEGVIVYEVCQGVQNSKPMTHSILTATQSSVPCIPTISPNSRFPSSEPNDSSPTSSTSSSSSTPLSSTSFRSSTATATIAPTDRTFISSFSSSVSSDNPSPLIPRPTTLTSISASTQLSATPTPSTASPASSSAAPAASPVLTKSQIAGVTIGCVGAAAISFGLLFFLFCRRRRRQRSPKRRHSGSSFGGDKIIESQQVSRRNSAVMPSSSEHVDQSRNLSTTVVPQIRAAPATNDESRWTLWPRSLDTEEMGVVANPTRGSEAVNDSPHMSTTSRRTHSQLLPDKPRYSLYPSPLRIKTQLSPISPIAGNADVGQRAVPPIRPSPRGRNSLDTSQAHLQRGRFNEQFSPQDPFVDPQTSSPPSKQQALASPSRLPYPNALNYGPWTRSAETIRKPVPARQSLSASRSQPSLNRSQRPFDNGTSTGSPRSRGVPSSDLLPSSNPQPQKRAPRRKSSHRRPSTYFSMNSDTSFEDAGDDEMPRQPHRLPSVAERSYPGQVRHPKIPGSVAPVTKTQPSLGSPPRPPRPRVQLELNPSVDKSLPRPPAPLDHPTSLLAKRRGNERATELAQELRDHEIGEDERQQTAKWKILVNSGLEGIKDAGTPTTFGSPRTGKSADLTSPTSRRRRS